MRQTKNSSTENIYPSATEVFRLKCMQTGTQGTRKAGNNKLKTTFSQENSQNDERRNTLQKRKLQQKVNGQEDHLTKKLPQEVKERKRAVNRNGSETQEPLAKMTKKRERPSGKK